MASKKMPRYRERGPGVDPPPETATAAGRLIREARHRRDFSQRLLANRLGVDQSLISRWERGGADPGFNTVLRVLGALDYDIHVALERRFEGTPHEKPSELILLRMDRTLGDNEIARVSRAYKAAKRKERDRRRRIGGTPPEERADREERRNKRQRPAED